MIACYITYWRGSYLLTPRPLRAAFLAAISASVGGRGPEDCSTIVAVGVELSPPPPTAPSLSLAPFAAPAAAAAAEVVVVLVVVCSSSSDESSEPNPGYRPLLPFGTAISSRCCWCCSCAVARLHWCFRLRIECNIPYIK